MSRTDGTRTAQYRNEKTLTPKNVNAATFGKKFSDTVDGYVYAQSLAQTSVFLTTPNGDTAASGSLAQLRR